MIKQILIAACLVLPLSVMAADKKPTAQQNKMATCNKDAGEKKLEGDARKTFMSECLSSKPAAAKKPTAQQEKMKTCNKDAGAQKLKGDARKAFMSDCLKKG